MQRFGWLLLPVVAILTVALGLIFQPTVNHGLFALAIAVGFFVSDARFWKR